jgi:membrane protease subunit HflK
MKWIAGSGVVLALLAGAFLYVSSGYFQLDPDEEAVVLRLGRYHRTVGPGPHFHLRFLEHVERQRVIEHREEFGFVTVQAESPQQYEERPSEKRMLTGDTNVVDVEFVVVWQIVDLADYSFNTERVPQLIRDVAQASMREVVAQRPIDGVLTSDKGAIAESAKQLMQRSLDGYGAGVEIQKVQLQEVEPPEEVKAAFREVISAEQDKERLILEARGYADQVVPEARGQAEALVNGAEAYKQTRILEAQGEAARFNALLTEYEKAPGVTRERLYIETLERILPGMEKIIVEEGHADRVLPYLPLGRARTQ